MYDYFTNTKKYRVKVSLEDVEQILEKNIITACSSTSKEILRSIVRACLDKPDGSEVARFPKHWKIWHSAPSPAKCSDSKESRWRYDFSRHVYKYWHGPKNHQVGTFVTTADRISKRPSSCVQKIILKPWWRSRGAVREVSYVWKGQVTRQATSSITM